MSNTRADESLALRVRARREALGLSRRQLDDGRVSAAYVQRIEDGSRTPSIEVLIVLAEKLETTALWLLTGSDADICLLCGRSTNGRTHGRNEKR